MLDYNNYKKTLQQLTAEYSNFTQSLQQRITAVTRSATFISKCTRNYLATGHRLDLVGNVLRSQTYIWIKGVSPGRGTRGNDGKEEGRGG